MDAASRAGDYDSATIKRLRRKLLNIMLKYLPLAIALTLMGCFGVSMLMESIEWGNSLGFDLGWVIGGYGAALGAFAICSAALWARSTIGTRSAGPSRAITATKYSRLLIFLAAVSAETATILDAPVGIDRNFVLWVNSIIAACLVLFALTADDVGQTVRRFDVWVAVRADRRRQRAGGDTRCPED